MMETKLTKKARIIMNAICKEGLFTREAIMNKYFISEGTVSFYLNMIYKATNSHNIAEIIYKYYNKLLEV